MGKKVYKTFLGKYVQTYLCKVGDQVYWLILPDPDPKHSFNIFFSVYTILLYFLLSKQSVGGCWDCLLLPLLC
jgi:hypothetical protein